MNIEAVISRYSSTDLRHVRRVLESELLAHCLSGKPTTQAHAGSLEMLAAVGNELYKRGDLLPLPPWVEVNVITEYGSGCRLANSVRVF